MNELSLIRERRFGPLFWTQFLGAFNDNFFKTSFVFLITFGALSARHDAALWTPALNGLLILPFFLFSAFAGQLADKLEKSRLVRLVKLWELGVMGLAAAGFALQSVWLLAGALFLMGTQSAFFGPVKYAILPQAVAPRKLVAANALVGTATFLAILLGTLGGGLVMRSEHAGLVTAIALVVVSVLGYLSSRLVPLAPASAPSLSFDWNPIRTAFRAIRFAREDDTVWRSVLGISWFWFVGATLLTLFPVYGREVLRVDAQVVTFFLVLFCLGVGLGALVCGRLARDGVELGLVPLGAFGLSLFLVDLVVASLGYDASGSRDGLLGLSEFLRIPGSSRIVLDLVGIAACGGMYSVPLNVLVQKRSDDSKRSRILSANGILAALFMVVSAAMTLGYAALGVPSVLVYLVLALMNAAIVVYILGRTGVGLVRLLIFVLVRVMYRPRVRGVENIPAEGPVLLAANHVTYLDGLILSAAISRPIRFVAYYRYTELPILRRLLAWAGVIPIAGRREDPRLLREAMETIARALEAGEVVCIFPEGRLTDDGDLSEFRRGIEAIVARTPAPVVPLGLRGLWGSSFSRARSRAGLWLRIRVAVGEPIPVEAVSASYVRERVAALV